MKLYAAVMLTALACAPGLAEAFFDPPYVVPATPAAGELVSVHIRGGGCDTLDSWPGFPQITQQGNAIRILFHSVHEDLAEWCIYGVGEASFPVAAFPAGTYTLRVDRVYQTFFGDVTETIGVVPFDVLEGATPLTEVPTLSTRGLLALTSLLMLAGVIPARSRNRFGLGSDGHPMEGIVLGRGS